MATILPDLTKDSNIKYGIPELYAARPDLFAETTANNRYSVGIVDQGFNMVETLYRLWINPNEIDGNGIDDDGNGRIDDINGWNFKNYNHTFPTTSSHANNCAKALAAPIPEASALANIYLSDSAGGNPSHFGLMDGINYAAITPGIQAVSASFETESVLGMQGVVDALHASETWGLFPAAGSLESAAIDESIRPYLMATGAADIADDTQNDANIAHSASTTLFGAYAGRVSFATPVPGSVLAMLYRADPTLTTAEMKTLLVAGAQHSGNTDTWCKYGIINHLKSYEALAGSITATQVFLSGFRGRKTKTFSKFNGRSLSSFSKINGRRI
jgi:subtilisin